jgi:hypothetical protein
MMTHVRVGFQRVRAYKMHVERKSGCVIVDKLYIEYIGLLKGTCTKIVCYAKLYVVFEI